MENPVSAASGSFSIQSPAVNVADTPKADTPRAASSLEQEAAPHEGGGGDAPGDAAGEASVLSCIFNLSNTILGSGTLAMSKACYDAGIVFFLLLLFFFANVANFTIRLLVICAENAPGTPLQYSALAHKAIGRRGELAAEWAVIIQQIGACCAYIVAIADVLQPIAALNAHDDKSAVCSRYMWQVLIAVYIIFPLCMLRSMDSLKFTSLAALACILALVIAVVVLGLQASVDSGLREQWGAEPGRLDRCALSHTEILQREAAAAAAAAGTTTAGPGSGSGSVPSSTLGEGSIQYLPAGAEVFNSLALICFAYLCHMNMFPVYKELKTDKNALLGGDSVRRGSSAPVLSSDSTSASLHGSSLHGTGDPDDPSGKRRSMFKVSAASMAVCGFIYALAGIFGYLIFLDKTEGDLLKNFQVAGTSISTPLDVLRVGFGFALIFSYPVVVWEARHGLETQLYGHAPYSFRRSLKLNVCIVGGTLIVGMFLPTITIPLGLIGSTCSPLIVFILPCLIFQGMYDKGMLKEPGITDSFRFRVKVVLYLGYFLIPLCTIVWLLSVIGVI